MPSLVAVSDIHVDHAGNEDVVDEIRPKSDEDWLIVAGDVADRFELIVGTLALLAERFAKLIWVPGNHDLWTRRGDEDHGRGVSRYENLVTELRRLRVLTPEDEYPTWPGGDGRTVIAPLFCLFDYTFRPPGASTREEAIGAAKAAGVVCTDEFLLHPDPFSDLADWSAARVEYSRSRLDEIPDDARTVLVNHWPLIRKPTDPLRHPEFAIWCGTERTEEWPVRYRARAVVYGHLHIHRTIEVDAIPHYEVSVGYAREWIRYTTKPGMVDILTAT